MLTPVERGALLRFARDTIAARLTGAAPPAPVRLDDPQRHAGAFVTLHVNRELRGCIGYPGSEKRLDEVVGHCAVAAATEDPRFPAADRRRTLGGGHRNLGAHADPHRSTTWRRLKSAATA